MAKTYQERATRNIKIILSIIANLEVVFGRNNFTAAEFTDTFSKMNGGDIWIDGCASVKEFLESLVALGDLDTTVTPSNSVIYFLPSKIAQPGHCGKGMKILFDIINSKIRFTLDEVEKEFAEKNNGNVSVPGFSSVKDLLDFWRTTGDLELYDNTYVLLNKL